MRQVPEKPVADIDHGVDPAGPCCGLPFPGPVPRPQVGIDQRLRVLEEESAAARDAVARRQQEQELRRQLQDEINKRLGS